MTFDEKNRADGVQPRADAEAENIRALYREYGTRIYRFSRRLSGNDADAEDLTQEVFLAAYRGADRFERRSSMATWLYKIALYRWRAMRRTRRLETVPLDEKDRSQVVLSADPVQAGLDRIQLEQALAALPEDLREAFLLVKGEGLLCREAAQVLAIPEGTLKSRVQAAVIRLQRLMTIEEATGKVGKSAVICEQSKEVCDEM